MKNIQSKAKLIRTGKEFETTYCLGCKDYTHNFKPQEVKMLRGKSNCVVFPSSKSGFLTKAQKQKIIKPVFFKLQKHAYVF